MPGSGADPVLRGPKSIAMWLLFKSVLKDEVQRLWRRLLRKPEPPNPYSQFRLRRQGSPGFQGDDPDRIPR